MPATRRRVLGLATGLVIPLAGCASLGERAATLAELEVELANGTDDRHVFHFAIETPDGLGEWDSHDVPPKTRESVVRDPPEGFEPVAIHGVVADYPVSMELIGINDHLSGEVCLRVVFEYGLGDEPTFLQSSDVRC